MRKYAVMLAVVAAVAVAGCSDKGKVREPAELTDISNPTLKPRTAWTASAGNGSGKFFSGLKLDLEVDALYAADVKGRVFAWNPETGKTLWRVDTKSRVISGPTVSDTQVLVGTLDAEVIALKRADGSELWRQKVSSEVLAPPASNGETVVARGADGRVWALSATSGERRWAFDRTVPNLVLRGASEPLVLADRVLLGMDNGRVAALRMADGQAAWEQPISVPTGRTELDRLTDIDGDLLEGEACVYVASFGGEVACVDPSSGDIGWRRTVKTYNAMALGADKLYVTDESGVVWALDAKTGAAAWKQESLLYRKLSPPAFFGGYVVVGDFEGYLHWMDPSDGKIVARSRAGSEPIVSAPVAGEKFLYVMNREGRIAAISATPK